MKGLPHHPGAHILHVIAFLLVRLPEVETQKPADGVESLRPSVPLEGVEVQVRARGEAAHPYPLLGGEVVARPFNTSRVGRLHITNRRTQFSGLVHGVIHLAEVTAMEDVAPFLAHAPHSA